VLTVHIIPFCLSLFPLDRGSLDGTAIVTLAPEIPGALSIIEPLRKLGIVVSMGHSMTTIKTAEEARKLGATSITHLFNAMAAFHHRDPGLAGLLGVEKNKSLFYGIIVDGFHTHEAALRIAHASHPNGVDDV
jgi:N-acetylglucosamine-6-phosphate deacetylase